MYDKYIFHDTLFVYLHLSTHKRSPCVCAYEDVYANCTADVNKTFTRSQV